MVTGACGAATEVRCGSVAFVDCGNQDDTMAKCIAPVTGTSIPMIQGHRHRCLAPVDSPDTAMGGSLRLYLDDLGRLSLISHRRGGRHRKGKRNRARTNQLTKTAPSPSLPPSLVASLAHDVRTDPGKTTVFHVIRMVICIAVTVAGQSTKEALHRLGKKLAASWGFKAEQ